MTRLRAVASVNHQRHRHQKDHVRKDFRDLDVVAAAAADRDDAAAADGVGDVDDELFVRVCGIWRDDFETKPKKKKCFHCLVVIATVRWRKCPRSKLENI